MQLFSDIESLRARRASLAEPVGLVPTMGNLHDGHLALVRACRNACASVVATIFVNPTQFGPGEDFASYPRTLADDLRLLEAAGANVVFNPTVDEMYPEGQSNHVNISAPALANTLCGASRPGHFDGVATVVAKLFNIASPGLAFFGEKDWQQLTLIRVMARQLDMPVRIMGVPTVRAANGLALSSRNNYLTDDERARAALIYRALTATRNAIEAGERNYAGLETRAAAALAENGFDVDYVAVRDADLLTPPDADSTRLRILAAARLGGARLIDNVGAVLQGRTALPVVDAATRETPSDHPNRSRIACDDPVRSQERKSFGCGLGDQKTVERILVDRRQHIHSRRMRAGDSQLGVTVLQQPSTQHPGIDTEVRPPKSALDGDLP